MTTKMKPCQVYLPRKLHKEILKARKKMEKSLGQYYSSSRLFREAIVHYLIVIENHNPANRLN